MYTKDPVWLYPEVIVLMYKDFCFKNNITERKLRTLVDAFLLRGRSNRNTKKVEILQESFEVLQAHIIYNYEMKTCKNREMVIRPVYMKYKYQVYYDSNHSWYTPKEVIENYPFFKTEQNYTTNFIGDLVEIGMITGKYVTSERCFYILIPSIVWLIKYHEYTVSQYLFFPPQSP